MKICLKSLYSVTVVACHSVVVDVFSNLKALPVWPECHLDIPDGFFHFRTWIEHIQLFQELWCWIPQERFDGERSALCQRGQVVTTLHQGHQFGSGQGLEEMGEVGETSWSHLSNILIIVRAVHRQSGLTSTIYIRRLTISLTSCSPSMQPRAGS